MKRILNEKSLNRIINKWPSEHDCGSISAFLGSRSRKENMAKDKEMREFLEKKGYKLTRVQGSWDGGGELSYFVVDLQDSGRLRNDLSRIGHKMGQESVLFAYKGEKPFFIKTTRGEDGQAGSITPNATGIEIGKVEDNGIPFSKAGNRPYRHKVDYTFGESTDFRRAIMEAYKAGVRRGMRLR